MRRMSFNLTQQQILDGTKTVTRRIGWKNLKVGERLLAVDRIRSKDAKVLGVIEVTSVSRERLNAILPFPSEVRREGFSVGEGMSTLQFVEMFCAAFKFCEPDTEVTRIEFRKVTNDED